MLLIYAKASLELWGVLLNCARRCLTVAEAAATGEKRHASQRAVGLLRFVLGHFVEPGFLLARGLFCLILQQQ